MDTGRVRSGEKNYKPEKNHKNYDQTRLIETHEPFV